MINLTITWVRVELDPSSFNTTSCDIFLHVDSISIYNMLIKARLQNETVVAVSKLAVKNMQKSTY